MQVGRAVTDQTPRKPDNGGETVIDLPTQAPGATSATWKLEQTLDEAIRMWKTPHHLLGKRMATTTKREFGHAAFFGALSQARNLSRSSLWFQEHPSLKAVRKPSE
jgi:hypothetical protein